MGLFWILFVFHSFSGHAEYRAFELAIVDAEKGTERLVTTTLDHLQYPRYYPVNANEMVTYRDSWRCWGNMSQFKPVCPKPSEVGSRTPTQVGP